jgi:hypothetical protein
VAKVLITYEADSTKLKEVVNEVNAINDETVDSAKKAAQKYIKFYREAGAAAASAFGGKEVQKGLDEQGKGFDGIDKKGKTLTGQLKQLKQELALLEQQGKDNTAEFQKLLITAAKLEDQIGDTRARVKQLASDTFKFDVAVEAIQGVAAAFSVLEGAQALFGEENQDLQKTIAKTQGALALLNGVQQLAALYLEQSRIKTLLQTVAQKINTNITNTQAASYTILGRSVTISANALKIFKAALVTTGVGALVVALGYLVQKLLETSESSKEAAEEAEKAQEIFDRVSTNANNSANRLNNSKIALLESQGRLSQFASQRLQEVNNLGVALENNDKETKDATLAREKEYNETILKLDKDKNKGLIELEKKLYEEDLFKILRTGAANEEAIRNESKIKIADIREKEIEEQKQKAEKANELAKKAAIDRLKIIQEGLKREEILIGISEELKIKQIENNANIEKQEARNSIKNAELLNATLLRIEAEKNLEIENTKLSFAKKEADNEIKKIEILSTLKRASLNDELKLIEFRAISLQNDAKIQIKDKEELELRLKEIEVNALNERNEVQFNYNKQLSELAISQLELNKALGDESISNEIGLINQRFLLREQELRNNAAKTVEAQQKLNNDLLLLEQERLTEVQKIKTDAIVNDIDIENTRLKTLIELNKASISDRIKLIQNEADIKKLRIQDEIKDEKKKNAEIELINAQTENAIRQERNRSTIEGIQKAEEYIGEVQNIFSALNDLSKANTEVRISDIETQSSAELDAINRAQISEQEKQKQRQALELRTSRAITQEKIKQAKRDKALAIFNAAIDTAVAILKTGAQLGYPQAIPFQIAAGVVGAIQLAAINAQQLPKFKKGGFVKGKLHSEGGTIIEAEKGEFIVNRSQSSRYKNELEAINTSANAFKKLVSDKYIRPALIDFASNSKSSNQIIKATLNSKSMEKEIKALNKKMSNKNIIININQNDSRYSWQ